MLHPIKGERKRLTGMWQRECETLLHARCSRTAQSRTGGPWGEGGSRCFRGVLKTRISIVHQLFLEKSSFLGRGGDAAVT